MILNYFMPELPVSILVQVCEENPEVMDFLYWLYFHQLPHELLKKAGLTGATIRALVLHLTPMRERRVRQVGPGLLGVSECLTNAMSIALANGYKLCWSREIDEEAVAPPKRPRLALTNGEYQPSQPLQLQPQQPNRPTMLSSVPTPAVDNGGNGDDAAPGYVLTPGYSESRACIIRISCR